MTKKHRTFDQGFKLLQKLGRVIPNTAEDRDKRKWTHCPFCGEHLHMWRETSRGALCVRCSTIGCFAMTELAQPSSSSQSGELLMMVCFRFVIDFCGVRTATP
jgi:hypothetical protein